MKDGLRQRMRVKHIEHETLGGQKHYRTERNKEK